MPMDRANDFAILAEPGGLETVLINAGALKLLPEIEAAAALIDLDARAFSALAVRRFMERADDQDWAMLTSAANAEGDALGSIIAVILRKAVDDAREVFQ